MLPGRVRGVVHGDPRGGCGGQGEGEKSSDHDASPACGAAVCSLAGLEEVAFGRAEWRVTDRIGADSGGGFAGSLEQAATVEVGRVAGVARPLIASVVQPGADDP